MEIFLQLSLVRRSNGAVFDPYVLVVWQTAAFCTVGLAHRFDNVARRRLWRGHGDVVNMLETCKRMIIGLSTRKTVSVYFSFESHRMMMLVTLSAMLFNVKQVKMDGEFTGSRQSHRSGLFI